MSNAPKNSSTTAFGKECSYTGYTRAIKSLLTEENIEIWPHLTVLGGSSDFLRMRAISNISQRWQHGTESEAPCIELASLDPVGFRSLWAQQSLFEPKVLYVLRRCDKNAKLAAWLKDIKELNSIKTHIVFEFVDKIPAELNRQFARLEALWIPCVEPESATEFAKLIIQMAKREGVVLAEDAVRLLLDAMGLDLAKLHNEITKIGLVYQSHGKPLRASDIAAIIGSLREDHVFELFHLLRQRQRAKAQLLIDQLLERGEKSIALIGILSRFAREQINRGSQRALRALNLCSQADLLVKSTKVGEALLLGAIVDALIES